MLNQTVKEPKLKILVKRAVIDLFQEIANDPDQGFELQDWVVERLKKFRKEKAPNNLAPLSEIKKRYSL